ncbi:hypothetical protein ACS0TY_006568 [Phlomoides rotata]
MEIVVGDGERLYSQNLRDFLKIKEEDHHRNLNQCTSSTSGGGRRISSGLTLSAILSDKGEFPPPVNEPPLQRIQSNRTLMDIIREDQTSGLGRGREDGRSSWKHLRDKIRLRRRGGATAVPSPSHDVLPNNNRFSIRHHSNRFNSNIDSIESTQGPSSHRNLNRATEGASGRFEQANSDNRQENAEENEERRGGAAEGEAEGSPEQPVRMSLMALLAENDRQMGYESSTYMMDEDVEEVPRDVAGADAAVKGVEYNSCCVCMVRHKGSAFIPCGHTFCRLCSRELWVQRGHCPLCNNYILEILDIF